MLFTTETIENNELNIINDFFSEINNEFAPVNTVDENQAVIETPVSKYITSLVCSQYQKSVNDIENTVVGNKLKRKRNFQQIMQESFFYGANRFGNNFIAWARSVTRIWHCVGSGKLRAKLNVSAVVTERSGGTKQSTIAQAL